MKKLLLSLAALVILGLPKLSAQLINADFETWTANSINSAANDPNLGNGTSGWWDFNMMSSSLSGNSPVTVFEGTSSPSPHSGLHYAEIVSIAMTTSSYTTLTTYGFPYPQTNGIIVTAYIFASFTGTVTLKLGIPVNNGFKSFSFWYRYIPNGVDTCSCTIAMYHWNSVTKTRTLLGGGLWKNFGTETNWTQATVNVAYNPDSAAVVPDTAYILFSACSLFSNPQVGDTMDIDDGSVVLGMNEISSNQGNVNVYPNPANDQINIAVTGNIFTTKADIYDITGKMVGSYTMHNNTLQLDTHSFNSGLYFYKLYNNEGGLTDVGKFSLVK